MVGMHMGVCCAAALILGIAALPAQGQNFGGNRPIVKDDAVEYLFPEQVTVTAGRASEVALHFRIARGLHINSHTPKDDYLIPTTLSIPEGAGVRLEKATYPAGTEFTLPLDPGRSSASIPASSRFRRALWPQRAITWWKPSCAFRPATRMPCMPPKTIPVAIDVIGK